MKSVVIAGYGVVGKEIHNRFFKNAEIYDPFLGYNELKDYYDCCIICVPTELLDDGLDTTQVEDVINKINAKYYLIKSTVPIGFCDRFSNVIFSPEFSGATPNSKNIDDNFTILGATTMKQRQFFSDLYYENLSNMLHKLYFTTNKEAELIKLTENAYLGYIVTFATEIKRIAEFYDVDYSIVSQLLKLDKRMPQSHIHVFENQYSYDSHCLNKDIPELAKNSKLFSYIIDYNESKKEEQ